ncbi:hypothetical protein LshimejAT787_0802590 [Lyophyllum shimeji]|uniref:Aminoglycoside phosphotransferase domain-containing protein n=1 Tax=Lyophyllum shimeji TaxID=47721 RepID=A0A9P3UP75_LYOSH|nr:hypothetical protein LshimejAT787_0802590 [Lyophyllum shimeji]
MTWTFDFVTYLHLKTGDHWEVVALLGGAANHTVRAKRVAASLIYDGDVDRANLSGDDYSDVLAARVSVVLKQAPAYLAKSPQIPFSPYRQTIEAAALRLLHQSPGGQQLGLGQILSQNALIAIPKLVLHDNAYNVLIQSDLGPHSNLYEVLVSSDTSPRLASHLGKTIGLFLANLHDAFSKTSDTDKQFSDLVAAFANEDAERVMLSVIGQATSFMRDAEVPDYEALGKLAASHWSSRDKRVFSQGDLWFGTLLVRGIAHDQSPDTVEHLPDVTIGICDWEFAGPNHPAADIAQLGAYLHMLSLSPLNSARRNDILMAFSAALYETYFATASAPYKTGEYLRSLLIMHGWEMANAAGWDSRQHMWCHCVGNGVRCSHIKAMVQEGALFLRSAASETISLEGLELSIPWVCFFRLSIPHVRLDDMATVA